MSDYISEEVMVEILKRLPAKSLVKFRCVCKKWYTLISSSTFISIHLAQSIQSNKTYALVEANGENLRIQQFRLYNDDESFSEHEKLELIFKNAAVSDSYDRFKIVGSCNGLVCVSDRVYDRLYLWNPSIREYITICSRVEWCNFAFGYDYKKNDYKVLGITYCYERMAYLYNLSSKSWRSIYANLTDRLGVQCTHTYLNGVAHWIAVWKDANFEENSKVRMSISTFCFSNDEFGELLLPSNALDLDKSKIFLIVYGQSLALVQSSFEEYWKCSIWVMKVYGESQSWSKQFNLDFTNLEGFAHVICFQGDGEILLQKSEDEIASYELKSGKITEHGYCGLHTRKFYIESLIFLQNRWNLEE